MRIRSSLILVASLTAVSSANAQRHVSIPCSVACDASVFNAAGHDLYKIHVAFQGSELSPETREALKNPALAAAVAAGTPLLISPVADSGLRGKAATAQQRARANALARGWQEAGLPRNKLTVGGTAVAALRTKALH